MKHTGCGAGGDHLVHVSRAVKLPFRVLPFLPNDTAGKVMTFMRSILASPLPLP